MGHSLQIFLFFVFEQDSSERATHIKIWITGQQKWSSRQFFCGRSLNALCENCPESELFLICIFSIRTLYGKLWTRKNSKFGNLSRSDLLYKKRSFLLRLSLVNVTKSAENCRFGHIYWRNPSRKTTFLCSDCCFCASKLENLGRLYFYTCLLELLAKHLCILFLDAKCT